MAVAFHSVAARNSDARRREHVCAVDAATPNCCQERQTHLHSGLLSGRVPGDLRRLTFDMRGAQKAQPFGHPLDGRVRRLHLSRCSMINFAAASDASASGAAMILPLCMTSFRRAEDSLNACQNGWV